MAGGNVSSVSVDDEKGSITLTMLDGKEKTFAPGAGSLVFKFLYTQLDFLNRTLSANKDVLDFETSLDNSGMLTVSYYSKNNTDKSICSVYANLNSDVLSYKLTQKSTAVRSNNPSQQPGTKVADNLGFMDKNTIAGKIKQLYNEATGKELKIEDIKVAPSGPLPVRDFSKQKR